MKNQYVLGYVSSNTTKDSTWRKIRVKVDPVARKGRLSVRCQGWLLRKLGAGKVFPGDF